jgi:hypothetical protein
MFLHHYYKYQEHGIYNRIEISETLTDKELDSLLLKIQNGKFSSEFILVEKEISNKQIKKLFSALKTTQSICSLTFKDCKLTDEEMPAICDFIRKNKNFKSLTLSSNQFSDLGIRELLNVLQHNIKCTFLDLSKNFVSSIMLKRLNYVIQRNRDFERELLNIDYYKFSSLLALQSNCIDPVNNIILDYCNDSQTVLARNILKRQLYPHILAWGYRNNKEKNVKQADEAWSILLQKKCYESIKEENLNKCCVIL